MKAQIHWRVIIFCLVLCLPILPACEDADDDHDADQEQFAGVRFPQGFLWGTASASFQVEGYLNSDGSIVASNWQEWIKLGHARDGTDNYFGSGFWTGYAADWERAADLGNNTYRLSLSWARLEPQPGIFDEAALEHYIEIIDAGYERGLTPMITLYHWDVPAWLESPADETEAWGAENAEGPGRFEQFVRWVVPRLADRVDLWCVVNELWVPVLNGYLGGDHPPGHMLDLDGGFRALFNLMSAHAKGYHAIKDLDRKDADGDGYDAIVGLAMMSNNNLPLDSEDSRDQAAAAAWNYININFMLNALTSGWLDLNWDYDYDDTVYGIKEGWYPEMFGTLDYIGVNYYGPQWIEAGSTGGMEPFHGMPVTDPDRLPTHGVSEFGTNLYVDGFREAIRMLGAYNLPMYITENGCADCDDDQRPRYLVENLWALAELIDEGFDIRGYYQWSLTDNFEWTYGQGQCFGVYKTYWADPSLPKIERPSADIFRQICTDNGVSEELYEQYKEWGW